MSDVAFYFKEGWQHIISFDALDHQLFLLALCAIYLLKDWKQVLVLITAFTLGHSLTLALSVYDMLRIKNNWAEILIPCTIVVTSLFNFFQKNIENKNGTVKYLIALFFGLIHGLGFANTIRFMLPKNVTIGWSLFGFNIGLETGQIIVVGLILLLSFLFVNIIKLPQRWWIMSLSSVALVQGVKFMLERMT